MYFICTYIRSKIIYLGTAQIVIQICNTVKILFVIFHIEIDRFMKCPFKMSAQEKKSHLVFQSLVQKHTYHQNLKRTCNLVKCNKVFK